MDPAKEQFTGIVPGIGLASFRDSDGVDRFLVLPGDDVKITFPTAGTPPKAVSDTFTIVDFYESKMSEYDSNFVFVPIGALQRMRGMVDPQTGLVALEQKLDPGMLLSQPALSALSIVIGLIVGWVAATLICGVLVTLLDIRDDINDRLPRAK